MILTLPYPISVNRIHKPNSRGGISSAKGVTDYKWQVLALARLQGARVLTGEVVARVDLYRARDAGDADNALKLLADSLIDVAYVDDDQIVEWQVRRFTQPSNPCVVIEITPLAGILTPLIVPVIINWREIE